MDKKQLVIFGVAGLLVYGLWVFVGKKPTQKPISAPIENDEGKTDEV